MPAWDFARITEKRLDNKKIEKTRPVPWKLCPSVIGGGRLQMAISASPAMPRAYSDDLRCKLLQVYVRSDIGLEELAKQFGVSYGYTKKIRRQQLQSGQRERVPQSRYGP